MCIISSHPAFEKLKSLESINIIIDDLFESKNKSFIDFVNKINEYSKLLSTNDLYGFVEGTVPEVIEAKIKGDIFEIFVMYVFQKLGNFHDVGVVKDSYKQISDDEDCGLDFIAIYGRDETKKVFGQIKFRDPNIPVKADNVAFSRITKNKLIGEACSEYNAKIDNDVFFFVTNMPADKAMTISLKNTIGWNGTNPDVNHSFIKICDFSVFEKIVGYNSISFWNEFKNMFSSEK